MPFTEKDRSQIRDNASRKFTSYCHAVHPVTFKWKELYRAAWSDVHWDAMHLLRGDREDALSTGYFCKYTADFSRYTNRPDWLPANPALRFEFIDGKMPYADTEEKHVGEEVAMDMRRWILKRCYLDHQRAILRRELSILLTRRHNYGADNNRSTKTAVVNTPRILHGVWPEVTPFMPEDCRAELRNSHTKTYPLPRDWDEETLKEFQTQAGMSELNTVLLAVSIMDDCTDENYPTLLSV